jgi:probable phosphoglycerate mutase
MDSYLRVIYLGRHDETAWTLRGQPTGPTDLPFTPQGEGNARGLTTRLADLTFAQVFTSRLHRLRPRSRIQPKRLSCLRTAYEGLRLADIGAKRPDWQLFRNGCPEGESLAQVKARADSVLRRVRAVKGDVPLFSLESGRI